MSKRPFPYAISDCDFVKVFMWLADIKGRYLKRNAAPEKWMGFNLNNVSICKKLTLLLGTVIVYGSIVTLLAVIHMHWMKKEAMRLYEDSVIKTQCLLKLKTEFEVVRRSMLTIMLTQGDSDLKSRMNDVSDASLAIDARIGYLLEAFGHTDPDIESGVGEVKALWEEFRATREEALLPFINTDDIDSVIAYAAGLQEQRFSKLSAIMDRLVDSANTEALGIKGRTETTFRLGVYIFLTLALLGSAVAIFIIYYFSRNTSRRFASVIEVIKKFNGGETNIKLKQQGTDEFGLLERSLHDMFAKLYENKVAQEQFNEIIAWDAREYAKKSAELAKSEEKFRGLVETIGDWVWEIDGKGTYTYASPNVKDLLGYEPEEVVGKTPFDLMPPEEAERIKRIFRHSSEKREPFVCVENSNIHKDGRLVVLETSGAPFYGAEGVFLGYRGVGRDITARRKAEEEKQRIKEQLIHSDKMASIGQLAAGVAHEINNPIGFVSSNLNMLDGYAGTFMEMFKKYFAMSEALDAGDTQGALEHLKKIREYQKEVDIGFILHDIVSLMEESKDGMSRIKGIVKGLKDFSHSGGEEMVVSDLNECVESAVRLCWHDIKYNAELEKDMGELPPVPCRPRQMTQVFLNMLVNASQAIPEKGRISIRSFVDDSDAVVEIRDNGTGIPDGIIKRVFDPFFTTKPVGKGTGLGLSIAYGIIKEHKGRIEVESPSGGGTTFRVCLPLLKQMSA